MGDGDAWHAAARGVAESRARLSDYGSSVRGANRRSAGRSGGFSGGVSDGRSGVHGCRSSSGIYRSVGGNGRPAGSVGVSVGVLASAEGAAAVVEVLVALGGVSVCWWRCR